MQGGPVLDWSCTNLVAYPGIPPYVLTVGPYLAFVFPLPYECEAAVFIVAFDELGYSPELADFAAPSRFHCGWPEIIYGLPE